MKLFLFSLVAAVSQAQWPSNCTDSLTRACRTTIEGKTLPQCPERTAAKLNLTTCCFDCWKYVSRNATNTTTAPANACPADAYVSCKASLQNGSVPICVAGQTPQMLGAPNCCFDCKPAPSPVCNQTAKDTCLANMNAPDFLICADDTPPQRTVDCCLTCKPGAATALTCDEKDAATCFKQLKNGTIAACAAGVHPRFDPVTCCMTCRKNVTEANPDGTCTAAARQDASNKAPVCAVGEHPALVPGACGPSCKRVEWTCTKLAVAQCLSNRTACTANEQPTDVFGECCPSCLRQKPVCTPACADTTKCVTTENGTACRAFGHPSSFLIKAASRAEFNGNISADQMANFIKETVTRFCERPENVNPCASVQMVLDGLNVTVLKLADDRANVTVTVADAASASRRLLQTGAGLVGQALTDSIAGQGISVSTQAAAAGSTSSAPYTSLGAAAFFVALVAALF